MNDAQFIYDTFNLFKTTLFNFLRDLHTTYVLSVLKNTWYCKRGQIFD